MKIYLEMESNNTLQIEQHLVLLLSVVPILFPKYCKTIILAVVGALSFYCHFFF
jgi:hypothetical protein